MAPEIPLSAVFTFFSSLATIFAVGIPEHLGSNAAVALHTGTHDGDLGAGGVHTDIAEVCAFFQHISTTGS